MTIDNVVHFRRPPKRACGTCAHACLGPHDTICLKKGIPVYTSDHCGLWKKKKNEIKKE